MGGPPRKSYSMKKADKSSNVPEGCQAPPSTPVTEPEGSPSPLSVSSMDSDPPTNTCKPVEPKKHPRDADKDGSGGNKDNKTVGPKPGATSETPTKKAKTENGSTRNSSISGTKTNGKFHSAILSP